MKIINSIDSKLNIMIEEKSAGTYKNFRLFYLDNHLYIRNLLFRLGVTSELDDIVQNTFFNAWKKLKNFEKRSKIRTWLTKIAINSANEHFRKIKIPNQWENGKDFEKDHGLEYENKDLVSRALLKLSFDHRTILVLCVLEEYSLEEAAKIIKIPIGTVKSRLNRARLAMESVLKELEVSI